MVESSFYEMATGKKLGVINDKVDGDESSFLDMIPSASNKQSVESNQPSQLSIDTSSIETVDKSQSGISDKYLKPGADSFVDVGRRYWNVLKNPNEIVRGGSDFVLSIPGFLAGLIEGGATMGVRALSSLPGDEENYPNIEDYHRSVHAGLEDAANRLQPAKEFLIGPPTEETETVVTTIMAPALFLSQIGNEIANSKAFDNYPNVRGTIKFAGDAGGLYLLGRMGKSAKAAISQKIETVARESYGIIYEEQQLNKQVSSGTLDERTAIIQQKVLEFKKQQLENTAKEITKDLHENTLIKEELYRKAEQVAREKILPIEKTGIKKPKTKIEVDENITEPISEQSVDVSSSDYIIDEFGKVGVKYDGEMGLSAINRPNIYQFTIHEGPAKGDTFTVPRIDAELINNRINELVDARSGKTSDMNVLEKEEVLPVDESTGTDVKQIKGEDSPFFQDKEVTDTYKKMFDERRKSVSEDPELFTQKLINDVNRWYHGDESVNIGQVRDYLGRLAARGDELRGDFLNGIDHLAWKETVSEASKWASQLDNKNILPTNEGRINNYKNKLRQSYGESPKHKKSNQNKLFDNIKQIYKPGNTIYSSYWKSYDKVLDFKGDINNWEVKVQQVDVDGKPIGKPRWHKTPPDKFITIKGSGTKLYSGIPVDEAVKLLIAGAKKAADYTRRARAMKAFKPKTALAMIEESSVRSFIDKSGNIRKDMLDQLGDEGYRILQKHYLSKGSSSISADMLKQMRKEVYDGLSKNEKHVLDNLILFERMIDISKYKARNKFNIPNDIALENSIAYLETFDLLEKITPERAAELKQRASNYFDWMKKPLKDMQDAGLISKAERIALESHNYRRLKLVDVFDKQYRAKVGKKVRTVYDSGIEALQRGRKTDVFEPSSEVMALEVFNRAYGRIMNNQANLELLNLARKDPVNPFARVRTKEGEPIPSGWTRIKVFEEGKQKQFYISPEMSKEWLNSSPEISYKMGQVLRWTTGSPILRTFATGINWGFALANLPRDIMHIWFAARTFSDGKWRSIYNPSSPIYGFQVGRDIVNTFSDAVSRKGRYSDYIKEGGGMEFMVHQGRLFQRGRHIDSSVDKVFDFLGYFGETSEIMTRLSIRERVIRNRAKEAGISIDEARKNPDITREATFAARDYMDFGQGGSIAKALDNGFPYLSASIQGSRGLLRAFKDNPYASAFKLSQLAAITTGIYAYNKANNPKTMKSLKGNIDAQNNLVIPLGDGFGFEDEKGQTRYPYIKIPLDPGQKFFKTFFEAAYDKSIGNEVDVNKLVDSLKEQSPVQVTELPPTISGALGYVTNKDFWLNEDIWRRTDKPFNYPQSKEEYIPGQTPQAYVDLGKATGLSPERTKYAIEELVTGNSMWGYLSGKGYDAVFSDLPKSKKEQHLAHTLSKTPVFNRFIGVTNPYSQFAQPSEKAAEDSSLKRFVENRELDRITEGLLFEGNYKRTDVFKYIKQFRDKEIQDRLLNRFEYQLKIKDLDNRAFWLRLKGLNTDARARVWLDRYNDSSDDERTQIRKEMRVVGAAGGVLTKSFFEEVAKLRKDKSK